MEKAEKDVIAKDMLQRINRVIAFENMSLRKFSLSIGILYNTMQNIFYRNSDVSHSIIYSIIRRFPNISPEWLVTGTGEMLRDNNALQETTKELAKTLKENKELMNEINEQQEQIQSLQKIVEQLSTLLAQDKAV